MSHEADFLMLEGKEKPNELELFNQNYLRRPNFQYNKQPFIVEDGTIPIETGVLFGSQEEFPNNYNRNKERS